MRKPTFIEKVKIRWMIASAGARLGICFLLTVYLPIALGVMAYYIWHPSKWAAFAFIAAFTAGNVELYSRLGRKR